MKAFEEWWQPERYAFPEACERSARDAWQAALRRAAEIVKGRAMFSRQTKDIVAEIEREAGK